MAADIRYPNDFPRVRIYCANFGCDNEGQLKDPRPTNPDATFYLCWECAIEAHVAPTYTVWATWHANIKDTWHFRLDMPCVLAEVC